MPRIIAMPVLMLALMLMVQTPVQANDMELQRWYLGAGFGAAKVESEAEMKTSIQGLLGYTLEQEVLAGWSGSSLAMEVGLQSVSEVDRAGVWFTPLINLPLSREIDMFGRVGVELGQESTLVAGIGVAHKIERNMAVRLEYVLRQGMGALQFNLIVHPWSRPY